MDFRGLELGDVLCDSGKRSMDAERAFYRMDDDNERWRNT